MRPYQLYRWTLLIIDLALLLLIGFTILKLSLIFIVVGKRLGTIIILAFLWSWFFAYRTKALDFEYYTHLIKIWLLSSLFCLVYLVFMQLFSSIIPVVLYLFTWMVVAGLIRALIAHKQPKIDFLVYAKSAKKLPLHHRVRYCIKNDLSHINLREFDAVLVDEITEYPEEWRKLFAHAQAIGLSIVTYASLAERVSGTISLEELSHAWINNSFSVNWGYLFAKHVVDILVTIILMPIWLSLCLIVSILILLTMGWPMLFIQQRVGQDGKLFNIYKFRTMRIVPNNVTETRQDDERITRMGKLLRKFRLDELPQFWNVLKGDMSLIGPRPEWQVTAEKFSHDIPAYNIRNLVKPGITGWAQVNQGHVTGLEGNYNKLQYDIYYVKHFSFWLDMKILMKTIKTVLTGFGAK